MWSCLSRLGRRYGWHHTATVGSSGSSIAVLCCPLGPLGCLGTMHRGRVAEVDIADEDAQRILETNTSLSQTAQSLFSYEPLSFKKRTRWSAIAPHRSVLLDMYTASGGYLIHQSSLERQVQHFLVCAKLQHSKVDAATISYRLRVMMSHLRDTKQSNRRVPARYDHLRVVLDCIRTDAPQKESVDHGGVMVPFDDVYVVPAAPKPPVPVLDISDDDDHDDDWMNSIFTPKRKTTTLSVATPPARAARAAAGAAATRAAGAAKSEFEDEGGVNYDEIDKLLETSCDGPTAADYRLMQKKPAAMMKKPAAATEISRVRPMCPKLRKRLYSAGYHIEEKICKDLGMDAATMKARCTPFVSAIPFCSPAVASARILVKTCAAAALKMRRSLSTSSNGLWPTMR